jgi:GMP synthase (glutamine-hydrolysing)
MRIHYLQHVPFEGLGSIAEWAERHGHEIGCSRLSADEKFPDINDFDFLIVMGGPMGVNDEESYPWLKKEKDFLCAAIKAGKTILGICLGAQLIASVLGAEVRKNGEREIGWFPLSWVSELPEAFAGFIPDGQAVFHWHGDTFDIPVGALHLWSSAACRNQGFLYGGKVLGLQFHLETTPASLTQLIDHCGDELVTAPWVQKASEMACHGEYFSSINKSMEDILDYLAEV